jgi:iron complex transport system substrate-binding protein
VPQRWFPAADPTKVAPRKVFTGKDIAGAIAYASTLSYPMVIEKLPPMIAAALS